MGKANVQQAGQASVGKRAESRIVDGVAQKKCSKCDEFKALTEYQQMLTGYLGVANKCKVCYKAYYNENREHKLAYQKQYEQENREQVSRTHRAWVLKNKFNLTHEEFSELAKNGCMICGTYDSLCVDHSHVTNEVRGILCKGCNGAIGIFKDDVELLLKAAAYLESKLTSIPPIRS